MTEKGVKIYGDLALIAGSGNPVLAKAISRQLDVPLLEREITVFANENIFVQLQQSVRSKDVFIIQPTCSPVNYNLMELLILIDTVKRASAGRITAVMPFYAYARSDKKDAPRVPITARLVADMVGVAGADRFMAVDLHAGQIQGFFSIPGDEITVIPLLSQYLTQKRIPKLAVVAADLGFAKKARDFAASLNAPVAFVEKRRRRNNTSSLTIIGNVKGKNALIVDDEVDQGTTLAGAAALLRQRGALDVYAAFVHATFSGAAVSRLAEAKFAEIVCTDTEPTVYREDVCAVLPNLTVLSVGPYLAGIIDAVHRGLSVGKAVDDAQFTAP